MEAPNPDNWSKLSLDILRSLFERLSYVDFHRAKMVCSNWYSGSKQTVPLKSGSPWLMLFPENGSCVLYNPYEDMVDRTEIDLSGSRFLASCGKWFLMLDSEYKLYIIDVFSGNRIDLPRLERVVSNTCALKPVGVGEFRLELPNGSFFELVADEIRARLWVDEKAEELSVVWFFDGPASFMCFYKKGNSHYNFIPVGIEISKMVSGLYGLVLRGYRLYILTTRRFVRVINFSGQQDFKEEVTESPTFSPLGYNCEFSIAVTTAGEVLLVTTTTFERSERTFRIYKKDPNGDPDDFMPDLLEVDSLGDEALLLDLGITVPANHTLGIKPNSIYFTRHDCIRYGPSCDRAHVLPPYEVDICVFNLATKTLKPFHAPSNLILKDARWFFPMT